MKHFYLPVFFIFLFGLLSCSKKNNLIGNNVVILTSHDIVGQWKILQYGDSGIDKTDVFAAINIQFNSDESLIVNRSDTILNGNWSIEPGDGLDKLDIIVSTSAVPYKILQENWYVSEKTTTTLLFYHFNGSAKKTIELGRM